jgi:hypothetical protein
MPRYHGAANRRRDRAVDHRQRTNDATSPREPIRNFAALATQLDQPSFRLGLRVSTQATALDNPLARGASPMSSRELALRARQLVQPQTREQLATALEKLFDKAQRSPSAASIVPLPGREITDARAPLIGLVQRLRDPGSVYAKRAAMVSLLLRDGTGPAFRPGAGADLHRALHAATAALDGADDDAQRPPRGQADGF